MQTIATCVMLSSLNHQARVINWIATRLGTASDWDKAREVESAKFKVERKGSSLTHFPRSTFHCSLLIAQNTRKSHFTAEPTHPTKILNTA
jgi:hypothetical protein